MIWWLVNLKELKKVSHPGSKQASSGFHITDKTLVKAKNPKEAKLVQVK
jgi:hypothetical protein